MRRLLLLASLAALPAWTTAPSPPASCEAAIMAAEKAAHTAPGLLGAIGLVESGRAEPRSGRRRAWPWTVSAEGIGTYYASKAEAITAVQALQAKGVASIDVGCMQVNLLHHPAAFASLEQAFEPGPNAAYAARFLNGLHAKLGDWTAASAAYHSLTPGVGAPYAKLVAAVWSGAPVPVAKGPDGREIVLFPGGGQMRIFRIAGVEGVPGRVFGYLN